MAFVVLKHTENNGEKKTIIVNDSEGIPIEFVTFEEAEKVKELFQSNTTHNSIYEVKKMS